MRVVAIIQARLNSARFPRKVLADIGGRPLLAHVIERARATPGVHQVFLALPQEAEDMQAGLEIARRFDYLISVMAPAVAATDVLGRFHAAIAPNEADVIVRVTGDCPLLAPDVAALTLAKVTSGANEYATNDTHWSGYPDGTDVQVFTRSLLDRAYRQAEMPADREHVCPWMQRNAMSWTMVRLDPQGWWLSKGAKYSHLKLSVDSPDDLERVRRVHAALADPADFSFDATIAACRRAGVLQ